MRPTIYAVAEKAGVSIATVSRVLNDSPRVKTVTRGKVLGAIAALGYQPSASARGLAGHATGTIALVFPQLSGPFFSELIRGAEKRARESGYHLLIYGTQEDVVEGSQQRLLDTVTTKVDGLILAQRSIQPGYLHTLHRQHLPIVMMGETPEKPDVDNIRPDNLGGAHQAVTHLIRHGRQRIGFVGGPAEQVHASDRLTGYRQALIAASVPWRLELEAGGAFDEASGYAAMVRLLEGDPRPDAVFAANDQMAIGVMAAVRDQGLHVPEDIAVVGFDDIEAARYLQPPLTTVRQSIYEQGRLAVHFLLARIDEPDRPAQTEVVPTALVVRRSCGCPA